MSDADLLGRIEAARSRRRLTQSDIALACGVTQPHLSKVLAKRANIGPKLRQALERWLESSGASPVATTPDEMANLVMRLSNKSPDKHKKIMQILRLLDGLTA